MKFEADGSSFFSHDDIEPINEMFEAFVARYPDPEAQDSDSFSIGNIKDGSLVDAKNTENIVKLATKVLYLHVETSYETHLYAIDLMNRYYREVVRPQLYQRD